MEILIPLGIAIVFMYLVFGMVNKSVLGGSWAGCFGLKSEYFVNNGGSLLYHYTKNYLPNYPKVCSEFVRMHEDELTFEECFERLSTKDKARYVDSMLPWLVPADYSLTNPS